MEKVTPAIRKFVKSLATAKGRKAEKAFVTERTKNVTDLLDSRFKLRLLIATYAWFEEHKSLRADASKCLQATMADMERMTTLSSPSDVLAVFDIPDQESVGVPCEAKLYLALDGIQDPGNLGTIIRLADWFGVDTIYTSADTVDPYNPKCVIASMGSIGHVDVIECDLPETLADAAKRGLRIWGTFLDGRNIYELKCSAKTGGIIVMGNEGKGISPQTAATVTDRISIPSYPPGCTKADSLNVAMATAITLAEFRRP